VQPVANYGLTFAATQSSQATTSSPSPQDSELPAATGQLRSALEYIGTASGTAKILGKPQRRPRPASSRSQWTYIEARDRFEIPMKLSSSFITKHIGHWPNNRALPQAQSLRSRNHDHITIQTLEIQVWSIDRLVFTSAIR